MSEGVSGYNAALTRLSVSPGEPKVWARARIMLRAAAITNAADMPLLVASPSAELRKNRPSDGRLCVPNGRSQKLPNEPLKRDYLTYFSSLSSHSLMLTSC